MSSNKKLELRTKMQQLQKEYSASAAELKELEELEGKAVLRERYKDYVLKVFVTNTLPEEPKFEEVNDEDREHTRISDKTGIIFSGGFNDGAYLMLKSEADYPRLKILYDRIDAFKSLEDKNTRDKEKYIKVILGEPVGD